MTSHGSSQRNPSDALIEHGLSRRRLLGTTAAAAGAALLTSRGLPVAAQDKVELVFTYWGSPQEQEAVAQMCESFNEQHPNIEVRPQYVPNDGYTEKMTTMLAGGTPPDIAYMDAEQAFDWALQGKTLDLTPFVQADPESATLLPNTNYTYDNGTKTLSTSLAIGIMLTYFNKKMFDEAGLAYPPSKVADAWQWNDFVEVAKRLTKDRSGRDATDPAFDPDDIDVYGVNYQTWWGGYMPFVFSNGGDFASPDGMELWLNKPEAVEALQNIADLTYKHHVAPTPSQSSSMPATDILLRTGKLAMDLNGMWKVLDYSQYKDLDWSVGVLPYLKEPTTLRWGIPIIISATVSDPAAAYEFYRWRYSPERIDLYKRGLWMPIQGEYYTDPAKIDTWINGIEGVFPPESKDVFIDYALNNAKQPPIYSVMNLGQIQNEAVGPALQALFAGEKTAQEAMDEAAANAVMQGRY
ncbi:MAG: multiple sugar transport system substrate-binding protein [Thermomicrobiales bacterium]|jgi:multiple sugar transport system substrate-binding protein|nr:multiple sugar transport system substrate-binding protein [Thermomicrobiales bacterium]